MQFYGLPLEFVSSNHELYSLSFIFLENWDARVPKPNFLRNKYLYVSQVDTRNVFLNNHASLSTVKGVSTLATRNEEVSSEVETNSSQLVGCSLPQLKIVFKFTTSKSSLNYSGNFAYFAFIYPFILYLE